MYGTENTPVASAQIGVPEPADLEADLMRPEAYPSPGPQVVELRQTHVSWVFMTPGDVFKVKKPVNLGFLDFRTIEARREACEAEVTLNARLATGTSPR